MFEIHVKWLGALKSLFLYGILTVVSSGSATALDKNEALCTGATRAHHDVTLRHFTEAGDRPHCFETYVPSSGIWMIEVNVPEPVRVEPKIELFGQLCGDGRKPFTYVERLATSLLVEVHAPGDYLYCVRSQDPERALGEYKLTSGFTPRAITPAEKAGDPKEEEPEPDQKSLSGGVSALDDLCGRSLADDHADTFRCATALVLGEEVSAEIASEWGDDDLFVFVLEELATVRIETTGDSETVSSVYDRYGHRLHVDGEARNGAAASIVKARRIVRTLSPGHYFVRVTTRYGSEGPYRLAVRIAR